MNRSVKLVLYVVLASTACLCAWQFKTNYDAFMAAGADVYDTDVLDIKLPEYGQTTAKPEPTHHLGWWGAGLVGSLIGLALLIGHDVSHFFGSRTLKILYNDEGEGLLVPEYEKAEEEWNQGNFLDAIRLMREHLLKNPRELHVALRIAEIYEKDLLNPLAAALEYEEVLKHKLPPERWGWAAIHLSNIYTGKLNQLDKSISLLRRLVADYPQTAAAEKARNRLAQFEADGTIPPSPAPEPTEPQTPPQPRLPPGFAPKKH
jgi:tetratricopeptide (TPR) repeat protein